MCVCGNYNKRYVAERGGAVASALGSCPKGPRSDSGSRYFLFFDTAAAIFISLAQGSRRDILGGLSCGARRAEEEVEVDLPVSR